MPYANHDWEDDSVAAVRVMLQYLSDQMYNLIRGPGLTYGVSVSASVTDGRIKAKFSRASQLDRAYEVFRDVIQKYGGEDAPWDEVLLGIFKGSFTLRDKTM